MKLSNYIDLKEETNFIISENDINDILVIHSLPISIKSDYLNFNSELVKQFISTLPVEEQPRALALILDFSTTLDNDPATCGFSICLRQLISIGYFTPQLLKRNQMKFLESIKIILSRILSEFLSNPQYAQLSSIALSYPLLPLSKRMKDIDITDSRSLVYEKNLELLLELYKSDSFYRSAEMHRFLPFFFNSIAIFRNDATFSNTQLRIFSDLLDLFLRYADKVVTVNVQVYDLIHHILNFSSSTNLPFDIYSKLIQIIINISRLNDELANYILNTDNAKSITTILRNAIKKVEFVVDTPSSPKETHEFLKGDKNYFEEINHKTDRSFGENIKTESKQATETFEYKFKNSIPTNINENIQIITCVSLTLQLCNIRTNKFRTELHTQIMTELLNDSELQSMSLFPYYLAAWLYQFIGNNISFVAESMHETNFFKTLYYYTFFKMPDEQLQTFVMSIVIHLVEKYHMESPYFLSDYLLFFVDSVKYLDIHPKLITSIFSCAIKAAPTFLCGCKLANLSTIFVNLVSELFYLHITLLQKKKDGNLSEEEEILLEKATNSRRQMIHVIDVIDNLPTVFQYFLSNIRYTEIILCHFWDDSVFEFVSKQLSMIFEQFNAKSDTIMTVIQFFDGFDINNLILLKLLECCLYASESNPIEMAEIFNNTHFLDLLVQNSVRLNCEVALKTFLTIFSKMTTKRFQYRFKFDIFLKIEDLIPKDFDTSVLWQIVFNDDKNDTEPRKIDNVSPISLLFAISIKRNAIIEFIQFIKQCFKLSQFVLGNLSQSDLPKRLLQFFAEYRSNLQEDEVFNVVFDFFIFISGYSMKSSDLFSFIRLCASLPGHKRPFFSARIIKAISKLVKERYNSPVAYFDLAGEKTYIQLPLIPIEVINNGFSLYFDIHFFRSDFEGSIIDFASSTSHFSVKWAFDKMILSLSNGHESFEEAWEVNLDCNDYNFLMLNYFPGKVGLIYSNFSNSRMFQFPKIMFKDEFSYFNSMNNVPCHISRIFLAKKVFSKECITLLSEIPQNPAISFHRSEKCSLPNKYSCLFEKSIADSFIFFIHASVSLKNFAINIMGSSTMRITGLIIKSEPKPLMLLDSIGGIAALFPFFGQIEQESVGGSINLDKKNDGFLPLLLRFFATVFEISEHHQIDFEESKGMKLLSFLLSLVSLKKLGSKLTIDAICQLFMKLTRPTLIFQMFEYVMFNFKLWIYLPVALQKIIYDRFYQLALKRMNSNEAYSKLITITNLLYCMRLYFWTTRTDRTICCADDVKMDIEKKEVEGQRPQDCSELRSYIWDIIKSMSEKYLCQEDLETLVSFCCDTLDLDFTHESIDMFQYLIDKKNPIAIQYMKEHHHFSEFFALFTVNNSRVLCKLINLYLSLDSSYLLPFSVQQWDNGIVREINRESIDINFVKILKNKMISLRDPSLSSNYDISSLTISMPRLIPLYLLAIQQQDEETMMKYFDLIDDLMKMDNKIFVDDWDRPFLLLLMAQLPNDSQTPNQISKNTIELLTFLYIKGCRNKKKKVLAYSSNQTTFSSYSSTMHNTQFFTMPHFVHLVSYQAKKDYTHIIRLIYIEFLKKENFINRPYSLLEPATFYRIFLLMAQHIMIQPQYEVTNTTYSYQDLLILSQNSLGVHSEGSADGFYRTQSILAKRSFDSFSSFSFDESSLDTLSSLQVPSYSPPRSPSTVSSSLNTLPPPNSSIVSDSPLALSNNALSSPVIKEVSSPIKEVTSPTKETSNIHSLFKFTTGIHKSEFNNQVEWKDKILSDLLIEAILALIQVLLAVKEKSAPKNRVLHPIGILGYLVETGLSFPQYRKEYIRFADTILTSFSTFEKLRAAQRTSILHILVGLLNVQTGNDDSQLINEVLTKHLKTFSDFLQKEYKITIPNPIGDIEDINFSALLDAGAKSDSSKPLKSEIPKLEKCIHVMSNDLAFEVNLKPVLQSGELSKEVYLRTQLEQLALTRINDIRHAAKLYRKIFRSLSSENGLWQTCEVNIVHHRRLCNTIFGSYRFLMKPNYHFTDHKDASLLRDIGSENEARDQYQQLIAKEKLLDFKGDLALVATDNELNATNCGSAISSQDNVLLKLDVRYVTMTKVSSGQLFVTPKTIIFDSTTDSVQLNLTCITRVYLRRYCLLDSAIEIFTSMKKSYFIDFVSSDQRKLLLDFFSDRKLHNIKFLQMKEEDIIPLLHKATKKWQIGRMTNFEYLLKLNKYAGRTYHDLSQYPVFPWVICDYTSDELDLTKLETFRDLSKPMGTMDEERLSVLKCRLDLTGDDLTSFLYGALYSSPAVVIGYLIRMEPFTSLHIKLQNGRFDKGDRLFESIPNAWESATKTSMDFRELIPEFFYFPDFLINENHFDFGKLSKTGEVINDVHLPKWASSPTDFVCKNREALETPFVTLTLHHWINLIFGPNSRLPNSLEHDNVFHPYYYDSAIKDSDKSDAEIEIIREYAACFGSAVHQLFKDNPPNRLISPISFENSYFGEEKSVELHKNDAVISISPDCGDPKSVVLNSTLNFIDSSQNRGHLELKIPFELEDMSRIEQIAKISANSAIVSLPWDCAIYAFRLKSDEIKPSLISRMHTKKITTLAIGNKYFATGSEDCTIRIWSSQTFQHLHLISKYRQPITALEINEKLRICVGASADGYISVNSMLNGESIRGTFVDMKDPTTINLSTFGYIVISANGTTSGSKSIVMDQNLQFICKKTYEHSWITSTIIRWNDGNDYLAIAMSNKKIRFYKLPFLQEINSTIDTSKYTVTSMSFIRYDMRLIIGDDMGNVHTHRFLQ